MNVYPGKKSPACFKYSTVGYCMDILILKFVWFVFRIPDFLIPFIETAANWMTANPQFNSQGRNKFYRPYPYFTTQMDCG